MERLQPPALRRVGRAFERRAMLLVTPCSACACWRVPTPRSISIRGSDKLTLDRFGSSVGSANMRSVLETHVPSEAHEREPVMILFMQLNLKLLTR